jgi:hypothetical protein
MPLTSAASALRWFAGQMNELAARIELPAATRVITADCIRYEQTYNSLLEDMRTRIQSRYY